MSTGKKQIALEATYKFDGVPRFPEQKISKRVVYALNGDVEIYPESSKILDDIDQDMLTVFWVAESPIGAELVLVSVGAQEEPLSALRVDGKTTTQPLAQEDEQIALANIGDKLGGGKTSVEDLTVWVEAEESRFPLSMAKIAHTKTGADAKATFLKVKLVLLVRRTGGYAALYVPEIARDLGPDDLQALLECDNLRAQQGNLIAGAIANLKGCERKVR